MSSDPGDYQRHIRYLYIFSKNASGSDFDPRTLKKMMMFINDLPGFLDIVDQLWARLCTDMQNTDIIRAYNRGFSASGNRRAMQLYETGTIMIFVCTAAAALWINFTKVEFVVQ